MWLSSSKLPRLSADSIRYPAVQIPSLMFAMKILLPVVLFMVMPLIRFWWELRCFLLVWANDDISPSQTGCSHHILVLFFFPNLHISSKSLLGLSFHEAALYGGCNVMSFQGNDRLIYSSVVSWLFSFPSWSLIEKIVFSLFVFYLKFIFFFNHWSDKMQALQR